MPRYGCAPVGFVIQPPLQRILMNRGYIKIWRKVKDSGLLQMPTTLALFMHILMNATHKPIKVGTPIGAVGLDRGQYMSGRHVLAAELKQTEQQIRTGLVRLTKLQILTIQSTSRYSVYTIVNYNLYQDDATTNNQVDNQQTTSKQPTDNQLVTTKQTHKHISTEEEKNRRFILPGWIDKDNWNLWVKKRKAMDIDQKELQVRKLAKWRDAGLDHASSLENSAANGYQGLFEPKQQTAGKTPQLENFENRDYGTGVQDL